MVDDAHKNNDPSPWVTRFAPMAPKLLPVLDVACGEALIEGARLLAQAADGIMPWRGRPQPLKRGLIARVPPIDFQEVGE